MEYFSAFSISTVALRREKQKKRREHFLSPEKVECAVWSEDPDLRLIASGVLGAETTGSAKFQQNAARFRK